MQRPRRGGAVGGGAYVSSSIPLLPYSPPIAARLPSPVTDFIRDHITSIEQLEVMLLLREHSTRAWSPEAISTELRTTPESVSQRLASLERDGLVARDGSTEYRFEPGDRRDGATALASCYSTHRVAVIEAIFAVDREPDSVRSFADAFRVRRDSS